MTFLLSADCSFDPKVIKCGNRAFGAYCRLMAHSFMYGLDGRVPSQVAAVFASPSEILTLVGSALAASEGESVVLDMSFVLRAPMGSRKSVTHSILERDGYKCRYCGRKATSVDHVTPRCQGGDDTPGNLVAACIRCNSRKGGRTPEQAGMRLR